MAVGTFQQTNFTAGQLGENIVGRTDLSKYYNGCSTLENFIPIKQGPVCRRPGTKYVAETKSSQAGSITTTRLIPFQFSTDQTYILEFGDGYVRFYLNRARLLDDNTTKAVGADADSPFELESPYRTKVANSTVSSHIDRGDDSAALTNGAYDYDATLGIVHIDVPSTAPFSNIHDMEVGNRILVEDASSTPHDNEIPGVFTVLDDIDADEFTYAKPTGGTTALVGEITLTTHRITRITTSAAHSLARGQKVSVSNEIHTVENVESSTQFWYRNPNDTSPSGTVEMIDSSVDKLSHKQSADVLFLTHPNVKPKELQRKSNFTVISGSVVTFPASGGTARANLVISTSDMPHGFQANDPTIGVFSKVIVTGCTPTEYNGCYTIDSVTENSISYTPSSTPAGVITVAGEVNGWQIVDFVNRDGPYLDQNDDQEHRFEIDATDRTPERALSEDTSDNAIILFNNLDEGRVFRERNSSGDNYHWGIFTWFSSNTTMLFDTSLEPNSSRFTNTDHNSTSEWSLGAWSDNRGWPRAMGFIQGRSAFGGNEFGQQDLWVSESNNINGFQIEDFDIGSGNQVADDIGINFTIDDDQVNAVHWLVGVPQGLLIGTERAEYLLEGRAQFDPITPSNFVVSAQSFKGSKAFVDPIKAGNTAIIFVQNAGRRLYQMLFDIDRESLRPTDITQLASDITISGVSELAYQEEPNPIVWAVLSNGTLIGCTYELEEEVIAWHKHPIGGTSSAVKSIATISDTSGSNPTEQLWMVVSRTINGGTVEYVEFIEDGYETGGDLEDAIYMDSAFTYSGAATASVTGVDHLEGETVKVFANGVEAADQVVSSGAVTVPSGTTKAQIGEGITSKLATMPIELRQAQPESNKKIKRLERANVSFLNAQGVQFGVSETDLENVVFSDTTALHTTLIEDMSLKSSYERNQKFWIVSSSVFPATVRSIEIDLEVQPIQD